MMFDVYFAVNMVIYVVVICFLIYGFSKVKDYKTQNVVPKTKFSIVVPFRNEKQNLPNLLESFSKLIYPEDLFEVVLVDDDSDEKFQLVNFRFAIKVVNNMRVSESPKKDAILTAINSVSNEWIVTTDADCLVNSNWLATLDSCIQSNNVAMIVGAVSYVSQAGFLHHFQQLDMASLQGATIGSFGLNRGFMCNGANFAYTKKLFFDLNGFERNDRIASGDDVFLLQKAIDKFPERVMYLKTEDNIVITNSESTWRKLFYQRVRWASKTQYYQSVFGKVLGYLVLMGNVSWLYFFIDAFFNPIWTFVAVCILKFVVDAVLLIKTSTFLKSEIQFILLSSFLYPFFSVSVAFYSIFGKYEWKGRRF